MTEFQNNLPYNMVFHRIMVRNLPYKVFLRNRHNILYASVTNYALVYLFKGIGVMTEQKKLKR